MKSHIKGNTNVTVHIIVWTVIYLFPIIMTYMILGSIIPWHAYIGYITVITGLLLVFYANYSFIVERFLFRSKTWIFILCNILILCVVDAVVHVVNTYIAAPSDIPFDARRILDAPPTRIGMSAVSLSLKFVVILLAISLKAAERVSVEKEKRQTLEKEKTEAELKNLKNKLNPHFLFNALNNIYALTAIDPEKAQDAIDALSKLLRYVLYENESDMVPLSGEMEFTRCYIDLMALRLDAGKSSLTVNLDEVPSGNWKIATLMFMTLIENAFKHGISSRQKSFINISIRFSDGKVECDVINSLFPKADNDKSGSGIGLENLRQRLEILYKDEYIYEVKTAGNEYSARLVIPLKQNVL